MMRAIGTALWGSAAMALSAGQAFALECLPRGCVNDGTPHAPEIDVAQGFAALAVLICVALVLRERFLRDRPARH